MVGLSIGLIVMFMMFGNRGCSWMPGNRVKNMIAEKEILAGDSLYEVMNCAGFTNKDVYRILNDDGDVNFSQSSTRSYPKKYLFDSEINDKPVSITFALYDSLVEITDFNMEGKANCHSDKSNQKKVIVPLPDEDVRQIIESHELRILNRAYCQMDCLKLDEKEILEFYKTATFNAEKSRPRLYPNPEYVMQGQIDTGFYYITYVIGDNRSRIADIFPCNCDCKD
ncbi:MAG: hypothetical protein IPM77_18280 [Crocinitomicaceae bacterium]|nr:hypothetical protein [Crocinitomicaceae bacterium]